ncbi:hypothetical protein VJ923_11270 [Adlercreutzia sp. R25]|uniref:Anti-sigma factor RsgI-like middle domain-containing protein n=1 Tax=Adlercreutzia shanghongiae TaxID=3111773 RepID=A0ABU6J1M1_9ACTN|nr:MULTISPECIES: hypothetical protein [unclassified Adlercreutzia]MEC4273736.1 hypothetical protein [Adlercreutzia sp. R25]MEC4295816.1 hypothetical protein [Adlercreutzia sp. R22]
MTDIEQRLREAYDGERLPDEVRSYALAAIEAARARHVSGDASALNDADAPAEETFPAAASSAARPSQLRHLGAKRRSRMFIPLAACLILALAAFGIFGAYRTPAALVGISVNPSIELAVNPFGKVIAARGLNEDGETVLAEVALDNLSYEEAITCLVKSPAFAPYLTADALVDVSIESDDQRLGADIAEQTDRALADMPCAHRCHRADGSQCGGGRHESGMGHGRGQGHRGQHHGTGQSAG